MIKKILAGIVTLLTLIVVFNWELISYGYQQASGQLKIIWNTKDVTEVLSDSSIPDSIKRKINIIQEVRAFSFNELGLSKSENYTTFYDQKGEVSLWNLSASEKFALEPKFWSFSFLGSFPYKGYFDLNKAKKEMDELKTQGYDVRIRPVGGWSTLGWTKDPILSNMLQRSEGAIAELIIHELTHSTLFVKDDIAFNENLASFIGEKGAVIYLNQKYGENSDPFFEYILAEEDGQIFRNHMLLGTRKLDSVYQSFHKSLPDSIKSIEKRIAIDNIISDMDKLHFHNSRYYEIFKDSRPNNAHFMSFLRYYSAKDSLENLLTGQYQNDLKSFIDGMKAYHQ